MKNVLKRTLAAVLALSLMLCAFTGCSASTAREEKEITAVLSDFADACSQEDTDAILLCLEPSAAKKLKTGLDVASTILGTSNAVISTVVEYIMDLAGVDASDLQLDDVTLPEVTSTLTITPTTITIDEDGETAEAECELGFTVNDQSWSRDVTFSMIKVEDGWYIDVPLL